MNIERGRASSGLKVIHGGKRNTPPVVANEAQVRAELRDKVAIDRSERLKIDLRGRSRASIRSVRGLNASLDQLVGSQDHLLASGNANAIKLYSGLSNVWQVTAAYNCDAERYKNETVLFCKLGGTEQGRARAIAIAAGFLMLTEAVEHELFEPGSEYMQDFIGKYPSPTWRNIPQNRERLLVVPTQRVLHAVKLWRYNQPIAHDDVPGVLWDIGSQIVAQTYGIPPESVDGDLVNDSFPDAWLAAHAGSSPMKAS